MPSAAILLALGVASPALALRLDPLKACGRAASSLASTASHASLATLCSAALLTAAPPAQALPPTIEEAIVEATEASYPIIKALDAQAFPPFAAQVGKILLDIDQPKLGKAMELGIDIFNSVPADTVTTFNGAVKSAFADQKTATCNLVPLPPTSTVDRFKAVASTNVDPAKLKAFGASWTPVINSLSKTDTGICLPPVAKLDELSLAQADVGRAFGRPELKRFFDYSGPLLKGEARLTDETLSLLVAAKAQAADATTQQRLDFQKATKKLEAASKREINKNLRARDQAEVQAKAAAKKAEAAARVAAAA